MKKTHVLFIVATLLLMGILSRPFPTYAATNSTSADTYTIRYLDKNGRDDHVWTGTTAEAQKIIKVEDAKRSAALAIAFEKGSLIEKFKENITPAPINPFLNRTGCIWPNGFLTFWNNGPLVCFANSGHEDVLIYSVYRVDSGGNTGSFRANEGPASTSSTGVGWVNIPNPIQFGSNQTLYPATNDLFIITGITIN